jgi:hypothetical protein
MLAERVRCRAPRPAYRFLGSPPANTARPIGWRPTGIASHSQESVSDGRGLLPSMAWEQEMCEHIVGHAPALRDALGLVESPVDAEIDAALTILFLRFRE